MVAKACFSARSFFAAGGLRASAASTSGRYHGHDEAADDDDNGAARRDTFAKPRPTARRVTVEGGSVRASR